MNDVYKYANYLDYNNYLIFFVFGFFVSNLYPRFKPKLEQIYILSTLIIKFIWQLIKLKYKIYIKKYYHSKNSIKIIPKTKYSSIIEYTMNDKTYKLITKLKRGPSNILFVKSDTTDITDEILPYLGPNEDLHNIRYTPNIFGYDRMEFYTVDGDILKFENNDEIKF